MLRVKVFAYEACLFEGHNPIKNINDPWMVLVSSSYDHNLGT